MIVIIIMAIIIIIRRPIAVERVSRILLNQTSKHPRKIKTIKKQTSKLLTSELQTAKQPNIQTSKLLQTSKLQPASKPASQPPQAPSLVLPIPDFLFTGPPRITSWRNVGLPRTSKPHRIRQIEPRGARTLDTFIKTQLRSS